MAYSALTIAENALRAAGVTPPVSLVADGAEQALTVLNRAGDELATMRGAHGQAWPELTLDYTLTTEPGISLYPVPEGFVEVVQGTAWDESRDWRSPGPVSPQDWQRLVASRSGGLSVRWRLTAPGGVRAIQIDPTPDSAFDLAFQYISDRWVRTAAGLPPSKARVDNDTDLPVFPPTLLEMGVEWRYRKAKGLPFTSELAEYEVQRDRRFGQHSPSGAITLGDSYAPPLTVPTLPDRGWEG